VKWIYSYRLSILFCLFLAGEVSAQSGLSLQAAPSENRISENASRCMLKDSKGYLWIGTIDGLNRYDGIRFQSYRSNPTDSSSLSSNYIVDILEDQDRDIWIATYNGLNRYDWDCDCFIRYGETQKGRQFLSGEILTDLLVGSDETLWVAYYQGLSKWNDQRGCFDSIVFPIDSIYQGEEWDVLGICESQLGGIWIGHQKRGFSYYDKGEFTHYFPQTPDDPTHISQLLERPDGRLWVGGNKGLFLFNPSTREWEKKLNVRITSLHLTPSEKLWAGVNFDQLYEWNEETGAFLLLPVSYDGEVVKGDLVAYTEDETGIIWVTHQGLAKQDKFEQRFTHFTNEKGNPNGLSAKIISDILIDQKGNLVIPTSFGGINYYDVKSKVWRNHLNTKAYDNLLKDMRLANSFALIRNNLWMIKDQQVYRFNTETGELALGGLPSTHKWTYLSDDKKGNLWLLDNHNIFQYRLANGQLTTYRLPVAENPLQQLHCTKEGHLYAISPQHIYTYNTTKDSFDLIWELSTKVSFQNRINSFAVDQEGVFWVGSQSGLIRLDPRDKSEQYYSIKEGLPHNTITAILVDDNNDIWVSTNFGLSCFNQQNHTFRNFDKSDGLQDEIFLPRSAAKGPDGKLYFGGVNGFNVFHPDSLSVENPTPPKLIISDFKIFNQSVKPQANTFLPQHISETKRIELSYQQSVISFELTALSFSQTTKNQYAYMIEGVDPDWNYARQRQTASYTGLPRGEELLFKAKAANHDGVWMEEPITLQLYIHPPFWGTNWFRFLLVSFLVGSGILYYRLRVRAVKIRNLWLEREVKKQTGELAAQAHQLQAANEDLKSQATLIQAQVIQLNQLNKAQARFFTGLSHEFRTPLTLLLGNLEELLDTLQPEEVVAKIAQRMQLSAGQLLDLINQLMDTAKLESGQYRLRLKCGDIRQELKSSCDLFEGIAKHKGLTLSLRIDASVEGSCWYDVDVLQKILNNLLSNAFKFTPKGEIRIELSNALVFPIQPAIVLKVSDDGIGMSKEEQSLIFNRFYQVEDPSLGRNTGTGIGLALVQQLVQLHRGEIEVLSEKGQGTTFTIYLPVLKPDYLVAEGPVLLPQVIKSPLLETNQKLVGMKEKPESLLQVADKDQPLVLVAEDNPAIRAFIVRQLQQNYRIAEAENGRLAVDLAIQEIPDLIISDVIMPEMSGFQLCEQLKTDARTSHIPIILLTALSEHEKKMEGLKSGADVYLSKPFSRAELIIRMDNIFRQKENWRRHFTDYSGPLQMPKGLNILDQKFLKQLNQLLEDKLSEEGLSINYLIKQLGLSRTQLFRKLKALTGMSAAEYIRDYRLRKAYELLKGTDVTVSEVIHQTGFNSRSYFYDSFKKKFGTSPSKVKVL